MTTRRQIITGLGSLGALGLSGCATSPALLKVGASNSAMKGLDYLFPLGVPYG